MSDHSLPPRKRSGTAARSPNLGTALRLVQGSLRTVRGVGILAGFALASVAAIPFTLLVIAGYRLSRLAVRAP